MCSSFARMVRPLMSFTGMMDLSKRPSSQARAARFCELDRISIDIVAREAVFGGDQIRRNALRQEIIGDGDAGIDRPRAARCPHADAAHGFDAAADGDVLHAGHDLRGREIDRIETGGAEAVDLHARNFLAEAGLQHRRAGNVAAGFADRIDAAEHHVLDQRGIEIVAPPNGIEGRDREIDGRHLVQRAIGLAAPARRANRVEDIGFRHEGLPGFLIRCRCIEERPGIVDQNRALGGSATPAAPESCAPAQNASIGIAIVTSAPVVMQARRDAVSGIRRSM